MNSKLFNLVASAIVLSFYSTLSFSFNSNSLASPNPPIEVIEHGNSSIFSSLSRGFDQAIEKINDGNENTSETNNNDKTNSHELS
ncbi:MAG: hypothetical protein AB7V56_16605 [Candidatus Nitrosocosmicus sp.]